MPELADVPGVIHYDLLHIWGTDLTAGWHQDVSVGAGGVTTAQLNTAAADLAGRWASYLAPMAGVDLELSEIKITDLSSKTSAIGIWTGSHKGTRVGAPLPANAAVLVNHHVQRRWRGGKYRSYVLAGTSADLVEPQHWNAGFVTSFESAFDSFWSSHLATLTWALSPTLCGVSYFHKGEWVDNPSNRPIWKPTPRPGGPLVDPFISSSTNPLVGSQRRRVRPG